MDDKLGEVDAERGFVQAVGHGAKPHHERSELLGILCHDRREHVLDIFAELFVEASDHAEIQQADGAVTQHDEVSGVGIGVVETVVKDHLQIHVGAVARHLALWMGYQDVIRVASQKTRAARHAEIRREVHAGAEEFVYPVEFMHPRLEEICDLLPRALGARAFGTLAEFREHTRLKETPGTVPAAKEMIAELLGDHEAIIRALRQDIEKTDQLGDVGTNDFLTGLLEKHEKASWMLRSFLA